MTDDQKTTLWLGAFRYYCGRRTHAVYDFCDMLIAAWLELPDRTRMLIQKELAENFQHDDEQGTFHNKRLGGDVDRQQWDRVRALWQTKE